MLAPGEDLEGDASRFVTVLDGGDEVRLVGDLGTDGATEKS
jgi:hypothetical protein